MSVYLNGKRYDGAYMSGHRVNGYVNGVKMFRYSVNVFVSFSDTDNSQTLYNVTLGRHDIDDLIDNYGLAIPDNYGISSYRVYDIEPNTNDIEVYISPSDVTETVNFKSYGHTVDTTTLHGKYREHENVYPPANYDFDGSANYQVIELDNGSIDLNVNYNPPYTPPPYIPPASSSSYTPQPQPTPQPVQPTMITRPITWMVPRDSSDYVTGGSDTISAPEGTVASLTGLAAMGITISAPDGRRFANHGNQLHFYASDQNVPVQIQLD